MKRTFRSGSGKLDADEPTNGFATHWAAAGCVATVRIPQSWRARITRIERRRCGAKNEAQCATIWWTRLRRPRRCSAHPLPMPRQMFFFFAWKSARNQRYTKQLFNNIKQSENYDCSQSRQYYKRLSSTLESEQQTNKIRKSCYLADNTPKPSCRFVVICI